MPVYIVRRASTLGPVGIFAVAVADRKRLAHQVQNCTEPEACEVCEVDAPDDDLDEVKDRDDADPRLFAGAILTDRSQKAFYDDAHNWQRVAAIVASDSTSV